MESIDRKITTLTNDEKEFILKYRKLTPENQETVYLKIFEMAKQNGITIEDVV